MVTCFPGPDALRLGRVDAAGAGGGAGGLALDVRLLRVRRLRRADIMRAVFKAVEICFFLNPSLRCLEDPRSVAV